MVGWAEEGSRRARTAKCAMEAALRTRKRANMAIMTTRCHSIVAMNAYIPLREPDAAAAAA